MRHQITSRKIHGAITTGSWLGKFLLLALVSAVLILLAPNLSLAQNATLTDDTHTNANKPNKNFGAAVSVVVREPDERGLLKFKLTPNLPPGTIGSHIGKATLKLFVSTVGANRASRTRPSQRSVPWRERSQLTQGLMVSG